MVEKAPRKLIVHANDSDDSDSDEKEKNQATKKAMSS